MRLIERATKDGDVLSDACQNNVITNLVEFDADALVKSSSPFHPPVEKRCREFVTTTPEPLDVRYVPMPILSIVNQRCWKPPVDWIFVGSI